MNPRGLRGPETVFARSFSVGDFQICAVSDRERERDRMHRRIAGFLERQDNVVLARLRKDVPGLPEAWISPGTPCLERTEFPAVARDGRADLLELGEWLM